MVMLQILISAAALVAVVFIGWDFIQDRPVHTGSAWVLIATEVGLIVQAIWGLARLAGPHEGLAVAPYVGYLLGGVFLLPIGFAWAISERTRAGTAVMLFATAVVPVLCLRLHHLWVG